VTLDDLRRALPYAGAKAQVFLDPLNKAMEEYGINTSPRRAMFLAQVAHESGSLHFTREIASGEAYEGRRDLGNTQPGDGTRYRGRGLIQITGRANYGACGAALGRDFLGSPELLELPYDAARSAGWFWRLHGCNELADRGDFDGVSDVINRGRKTLAVGDSIGWKDRVAMLDLTKAVFPLQEA
jgi:putative chitinase